MGQMISKGDRLGRMWNHNLEIWPQLQRYKMKLLTGITLQLAQHSIWDKNSKIISEMDILYIYVNLIFMYNNKPFH